MIKWEWVILTDTIFVLNYEQKIAALTLVFPVPAKTKRVQVGGYNRSLQMSKIALVTGGSSGIGRNATLTLAKAGYTVVATGRRQDALEETAQSADGMVDPIASDVTDEASIDALPEASKVTVTA